MKSRSICIILPVLNEEGFVRRAVDLLRSDVLSLLRAHGHHVMCVIATNGSNNKTRAEAYACARLYPKDVSVFHAAQRGRGQVLRTVTKAMRADVYAYVDIDLPLNLPDLITVIESVAAEQADITVVRRSGKRPFLRTIMTRAFRYLNAFFLGVTVHDPQCGVKAWSAAIATDEVQACREDGFFFDTELLTIATQRGRNIQELSVQWIDQRFADRQSSVRPLRDSFYAAIAVLRIMSRSIRDHWFALLGVATLLFFGFIIPFGGMYVYVQPSEFAVAHHILHLYGTSLLFFTLWTIGGYISVISVIWLCLRNRMNPGVLRALTVLSAIVISILLIAIHPTRSQDVYWNLALAHGEIIYGLNPYTESIQSQPHDEWNASVLVWRHLSMTHGPVWTLILRAVVIVSQDLQTALILLRCIFILVLWATFFGTYKILSLFREKSEQWKTFTFALLILNPLWFQMGIIDLHNDIFIACAIVWGVYATMIGKYSWSVVALCLGGLIKYTPWILIPIPLFIAWQYRVSLTAYIRTYLPLCFLCTGIVFGAFATFDVLSFPPPGLQDEIGVRGTHENSLLGTYILRQAFPEDYGVVTAILIFFSCVWMIWFARRKNYLWAACLPFIIIFVFGTAWFQAWYILWILPLCVCLIPAGWFVYITMLIFLMSDFLYPITASFLLIVCVLIFYVKRMLMVSVTSLK